MTNPEVHDLVVVGGGPAGLTAAVMAESERVDTIVIDGNDHLGGQAGTSSFIENYPGFPAGITGGALMSRFTDQASRFNTEFVTSHVDKLEVQDEGIVVVTNDAEKFLGKAVLLSTGVEFRKLRARNLAAYMGRGVTYGSPDMRIPYKNSKIFIVGGANSAGQAAVYLSGFEACSVNMLVRGKSIEEKMSGYLVDKVLGIDNIVIHPNTELVGVDGDGKLDKLTIKTGDELKDVDADEVFIFIGSVPKTAWLPEEVIRDKDGFVIAGSDLPKEIRSSFEDQTNGRQPLGHETSIPRLFVAGDVRCGTPKRVAFAAGDGTGVVPEIHRLREMQTAKKTQ